MGVAHPRGPVRASLRPELDKKLGGPRWRAESELVAVLLMIFRYQVSVVARNRMHGATIRLGWGHACRCLVKKDCVRCRGGGGGRGRQEKAHTTVPTGSWI